MKKRARSYFKAAKAEDDRRAEVAGARIRALVRREQPTVLRALRAVARKGIADIVVTVVEELGRVAVGALPRSELHRLPFDAALLSSVDGPAPSGRVWVIVVINDDELSVSRALQISWGDGAAE